MSKIVLVSMPFCSLEWPAIGIGQLVAAANNAGLEVQARYPALQFADRIGLIVYNLIANIIRPDTLLSEWFFSGAAFEDFHLQNEDYLAASLANNPQFKEEIYPAFQKDEAFFLTKFSAVRSAAQPFIEETAQHILQARPRIVGCSTTYMQYTASLALLRAIKKRDPDIITLLGGANCEAEMGYMTQKYFAWIDFVVSGEADAIFPELCQNILTYGADVPVTNLPSGVYSPKKLSAKPFEAGNGLQESAETAIIADLETTPIPDYSGYFNDLAQTTLKTKLSPILIMETSRGCWKGSKQPCNFCGQNGKRLRFRTKSPARVLQELDTLSTRYGLQDFILTDTIVNMSYFKTLFKELARRNKPYHLFLETVSTLQEAQIAALADAGVVRVQPGIESLHDKHLTLLNKGNSAIRNIAFLKYHLEQGIRVTWNFLYDIPGEHETDYEAMQALFPLLYHLEPPTMVAPIRFDRFSEYYNHPQRFGLTLSPLRVYQQVYPFTPADLAAVAYYFERHVEGEQEKKELPIITHLKKMVYEWKSLFYMLHAASRPQLMLSETPEETVIRDSRPCAAASEFRLTAIERAIYAGCRRPVTQTALRAFVETAAHEMAGAQPGWEDALQGLIEKKLVIHLPPHYLALATYEPRQTLPIPDVHPKKAAARAALALLKKLGA